MRDRQDRQTDRQRERGKRKRQRHKDRDCALKRVAIPRTPFVVLKAGDYNHALSSEKADFENVFKRGSRGSGFLFRSDFV